MNGWKCETCHIALSMSESGLHDQTHVMTRAFVVKCNNGGCARQIEGNYGGETCIKCNAGVLKFV